MGMRPVDQGDVTLDDLVSQDGADVPLERVRASYDAVASKYASELAEEIVRLWSRAACAGIS
jgi:hypothetical protein